MREIMNVFSIYIFLIAYPVHASKIQAHLECHGAKVNPLRGI